MQRVDEIDIDGSLVSRLIASQFPQWAGLPVVEISSAGTDNALCRLGEGLVARLPGRARAWPALAGARSARPSRDYRDAA